MKRRARIVARLLLAYFLALPILFGLHAFLHTHDDNVASYDRIEISENSDCSICDLYHTQSAELTVPSFQHTISFGFAFKLFSPEEPTLVTWTSQYLRGPPLS